MAVKLGLSNLGKSHSLMLREFGNRVLRKMFGPEREVITGG
jgi:hypothetical protein